MSRLPQIVRNSFIRLQGLFDQTLGLFGKLFSWINQLFGTLSRLLGFDDKSQYFFEESQASKPTAVESDTSISTPRSSSPAANTTRRRPDASMDYFLKMARQEKKSS